MNSTPLAFLLYRISIRTSLKNAKVKLYLLADIDLLLVILKGMRDEICHTIHPYVKANSKYIKDFDKNKETLSEVLIRK